MGHSPGPWKQDKTEVYEDNDGNWHIAEVGRRNHDIESLANARLIAAAPELLEACKLGAIVAAAIDPDIHGIINAAIAKATEELKNDH